MKLTRNQLKEIIRESLKEIDFKDKAAFDAYNKKHKMRGSTKVNIAGKDTTVGKASGKKKSSSIGDFFGDKAKKNKEKIKKATKKDQSDDTQDFLTGKNAESNIEKLNNLAMDGKPVQFDTDKGQSLTWDDADYETNVVYALDQDGEEVVVDFSDIVRMDMDLPKADRSNAALFSDPEKPDDEPEDDDVGGPSYANVPKGAKSTKQSKLMKKNDSLAKELNPYVSDSKDLVMNGMADDIDEFMNEIPNMGQDFDKADELLNLVRDNEMGERDDDDDVIEDYKQGILKALNTPGDGGSGKSGKDIEKQSMSAADAANAKMDRDEKVNDKKKYLKDLQTALKNAEPGSAFAKMYKDNIKKAKADIEKLQSESINESVKPRRSTIREIKRWMKTLEENRYRKIVQADARRVAWFVNNNLAEDYEQMPKSIVKKWPKAAYKRERYLAKEFIKYKKSEQKLRESIRRVIKEQLITEGTRWNVGIEEPSGRITAVYGHYDGYPEYVGKLLKQYYKNPSVIKQLIKLGKSGISTLGKKIGKKHDFNMPYEEKEKLGYTTFYGRDRGQSGNMSTTFKNMAEFGEKFMKSGGAEFGYVWSTKDKKWYMFDYNGRMKTL